MANPIHGLPNGYPYHFQDRIKQASFSPDQLNLVKDISSRYVELSEELSSLKRHLEGDDNGATNKKRKLENGSAVNGKTVGPGAIADRGSGPLARPIFEAEGVSFVTPQRKKFKIGLVPDSGPGSGGLTMDGTLSIRWKDIEQVVCTAVPEKATPAHYFTIIPSAEARNSVSLQEPLVFTVAGNVPQDVHLASGQEVPSSTPFHEFLTHLIDVELGKYGKRTAIPNAKEFQSAIVQAHRKGEKAYHVKAFRGSKDGFMYFLSTGILFGFKKPLLYFPLHSISSISYSSILQRTFNLNILAQLSASDCTFTIPGSPASPADAPKEIEFEFSMLDQADFAGIDAYVKGHGLNDASLAEARRAKRYNVNVPSAERGTNGAAVPVGSQVTAAGAGAGHVEEESELAKAERALQDAEDEEEEDYDPSGGESEGSGSESEEEEGYEEFEGGGEDDEEDEGVEEGDHDDV